MYNSSGRVQIVSGELLLNGTKLQDGDGAAVSEAVSYTHLTLPTKA